MSMPNLFIVGVGKAGTSALYEYLHLHTEIYMASEKELNFFGTDLDYRAQRLSRAEYLQYFEDTKGYRYRGDASVQYLLSTAAASEIREFSPDSRILILVRNPLEVMRARHAQNLYAGSETIRDFEAALQAEPRRKLGVDIPPHVECVNWLFYRDWVRYAEQITRYRNVFGSERVWVGVFDDLRDKPSVVYRDVLKFLGLSNSVPPSFQTINSNKAVKSIRFQRAVTGRFMSVRLAAKIFIPNRRARAALQDKLMQLNSRKQERGPIREELRLELIRELEPEVRFLEDLLGRDFPGWMGT